MLAVGFTDPPRDAAHVFRAALEAMARPGTIRTAGTGLAPPAPLSPAMAALVLMLADPDTALHLAPSHDREEVRHWIRFHCGAPLAGRTKAAFALGTWEALLPWDGYALGTPDYPDRSATLIAEVPRLAADGAALQGPGIRGTLHLSLPGTAPLMANQRLFPLGLDLFLTCGDRLAAVPRTTRIAERL